MKKTRLYAYRNSDRRHTVIVLPKNCEVCGNPIVTLTVQTHKNREARKYCSNRCKARGRMIKTYSYIFKVKPKQKPN